MLIALMRGVAFLEFILGLGVSFLVGFELRVARSGVPS